MKNSRSVIAGSAPWRSAFSRGALTVAFTLCALAFAQGACQRRASEQDAARAEELQQASTTTPTATDPARGLRCEDLRPVASRQPANAETVQLRPPDADQQIVLSKTGVVVEFSRDDFTVVARCLGLKQAQHYIATETGHAPESPLVDAFQLSYVAAALLDLGRASVRRESERERRTSIVRDLWSAEGCRGRCRSYGRIYRLTTAEPSFFFRVTDETVNDWE